MNDGDGTVFLLNFYSALETDRADRAEDYGPRSGGQSEDGPDQTYGQRYIQDNGVVLADANTVDISFLNDFFDLAHHIVSELLEIIVSEGFFFSSFFSLGLFSSGFFSLGLFSSISGKFLNYRLFSGGCISGKFLDNLLIFSYFDFFIGDLFFHF